MPYSCNGCGHVFEPTGPTVGLYCAECQPDAEEHRVRRVRTFVREWWNDAWWMWTLEDNKPIGFNRAAVQEGPAALR